MNYCRTHRVKYKNVCRECRKTGRQKKENCDNCNLGNGTGYVTPVTLDFMKEV